MGNLGDLKAQQLVLLAVFVSFITSVATGITTVSLIEAAPAPAQQVINRIVERTVERVVPEENPDENKPPEKEIVTVVVKEEDLAIAAAESVGKSAVRVFAREGGAFLSLGFAVGPHVIVADGSALSLEGSYEIDIAGVRVPATVTGENQGFALVVTADTAPALSPATIGAAGSLKLAQSLVAVTGSGATAIATGPLVELYRGEAEGAPVIGILASLAGSPVLPGALLANIRGEIVGIRLDDGSPVGYFSAAESAAAYASAAAAEAA